jgi:DNA sulfur modification protein DndD
MILDQLVLHDFGVYRGRQVFDLTPEAADRPVILIGAQNGAGKTTFLEGLQLALYGRLSQYGLRGAGGYEAYLQGAIHRRASPQEGARVEVSFRRTVAGSERRYSARRSWTLQKSGVKEHFEVLVDDQFDRVLTQHWSEFVEEMLPPRIAPLFFFDGEKIEQFADLKRSAEIVGVAIKALLGLDIVERLELDLDVLERRKLAEQARHDVRAELAAAEAEVDAASERQRVQYETLASVRTRRDRSASAVAKSRADLRRQGGDLFSSRQVLADQKSRLETELEAARKEMRSWAGDVAPLLLVRDLAVEVAAQARAEADAESMTIILRHLEARDPGVLACLRDAGGSDDILTRAEAHLGAERASLAARSAGDAWIGLSPMARLGLETLIEASLAESLAERDRLLAQLDTLEAQKDDLDRRLAAVPAPETIEPLVAALEKDEADLLECEAELLVATRAHETAERDVAAARARYQSRLNQQVRLGLAREDADRLVRHSAKARATLKAFKQEVVSHHVHRLERFILEALRELLRKSDLVTDVRIDPSTFAIELRDGGWGVLSPDQLSAGERQLLAVALLWALAKASGQAAPTVIDTPLGRLDSQHRSRLVERYFPFAGDQVILLSTDEEIDGPLHERLQPVLSRAFTIRYDAAAGGSVVEPGYAFATTAMEAA